MFKPWFSVLRRASREKIKVIAWCRCGMTILAASSLGIAWQQSWGCAVLACGTWTC